MYRFTPRLLLALVLGVAGLAVAPQAFAASSYIDSACELGEVGSQSSDTGDVVYDDHGIDAAARASDLSLSATTTVDALTAAHLRYCNVVTTFGNTLTVKPGTTGLAPGTPVTLELTVGVDGELNPGYDGPGQPEQEPAQFNSEATVDGGIDVTDGGGSVGHFSVHADEREWAQSPGGFYPSGVVVLENRWNWQLTGNRGDSLGNQDAEVAELCQAWPVFWPCGGTVPPPPNPPDYQGTHTILVNAHVGDTLGLGGQLTISPQALQAQASASFPASRGATAGLRAHVKPGPGFDGLTLDLEVGPAQAGPALTIDDASVAEGDSGTTPLSFPVHLSHASDEPVTVSYQTFNGTATQPDDYKPASGTLTFAPGETEKTITVDIVGDTTPEADETFQVVLNAPRGALVAHGNGVGTILDDDGAVDRPTLTVNDAEVLEGTDGMVNAAITVSLSAPAKSVVEFHYATADGTAKAPGDYTAVSGEGVIPIGETHATIIIPVVGDSEPEPNETLDLVLSNVQGATLGGNGRGTLTIDDDDAGCTPTLAYDYVEAKGCFVPDNGSFLATGIVHVNGLELVADRGVDILVDPSHRRVYSRGGDVSVRDGGEPIWKGTIDWQTPTLGPKSSVHVANLVAGLGAGFTVKGLPIFGSESLEFDLDHEAQLTIPLQIPFVSVVIDGVHLTGNATLVSDNARGLHSDSIKVTAEEIDVPPIAIKQLAISWDDLAQRWEGSGTLVLPTPEALSITAGVAFQNGHFAGASAGADNLDLPLGNGVFVQAIRFGLALDPLKISGGIGISAGPDVAGKAALRIDGDFALDFGNPFTVEAHGSLKVVDFPLASAWFRYFSTGTVQFGGTVAIGLPDTSTPAKQPVHLIASVNGWVNGSVGFAAEGSADVAIFGVPVVGADLLVSNVGAAACGHIAWLKAGFGYRWATHKLSVLGNTCDVGAFAPPVPVGGVAATKASAKTGTRLRLRLPQSDDGVVLELHGATGAPAVALAGPGGRTVATPAKAGASLVNHEFVVLRDENAKTTIVAIRHPAGRWTVTPRAGSPAVTSIEQASIGADPHVKAEVSGDAHHPTLAWKTSAAAGQKVTFVEHAKDVDHVITQTGGAKGRVSFTPAVGPGGQRDIVAIVERNGMPRLQTVVAHYDPTEPNDPDLPRARKRLAALDRSVATAHIDSRARHDLARPLHEARRALRPPTPVPATACLGVGDFVTRLAQASHSSRIPPTRSHAWKTAATAVKQLLHCA